MYIQIALLLSLFILSGCGGGGGATSDPPPQYYGNVKVTVEDGSSRPLAGATVRVSNQAAISDEKGECLFSAVPAGITVVTAVKPGMETISTGIAVEKDTLTSQVVQTSARSGDTEYDVVVVGAGTGGVAAAIQARSSGMRVALVEETDWIGGQMTAAAVTSLDEGADIPYMRSGIYARFVNKISYHYWRMGKPTGTAYFAPHMIAFEPSVGQKMLYELLYESEAGSTTSGIDLYLCSEVESVTKAGRQVTGLTLKGGTRLSAKVVIDASEYGDVLAMAGARYRVGNSTSDSIRQSSCIQFITYTAVIRDHFSQIDPQLRMLVPPPGYEMLVSDFRRFVTNNGNFVSELPVDFNYHNAWRGMPDSRNPDNYDASPGNECRISKTGINWFNDHAVTAQYVEDREYRKSVNCDAKLKTLQFLYYLQNDLEHTTWSVATDEGFATSFNSTENSCQNIPAEFKSIERHFPLRPYVREARRGVGLMTLTAADIKRDGCPLVAIRKFPTALAVGDYPVDLHGCNGASTLDCGETIADIPPWGGGTFQLPFEVFVPESVDGLVFAEKNLSVSRLVNGAIRLQPITMMTGQAAGAIAALAVRNGVQPRRVQPMQVQSELLDAGCNLILYRPSDVLSGHPYRKHVQIAILYDIVGLLSPYSFGINHEIAIKDLEFSVLHQAFNLPMHDDITSTSATRAYLASLLAEGMNLNLSNAPQQPYFDDVPPGHQAFAAIQQLHHLGIWPESYSVNNRFKPGAPVTRGEAAYTIVTALLKSGITPPAYKTFCANDQVAPTGSISINNGASTSASTSVQLQLEAEDDKGTVVSMQFSKDNGMTWYPWEPYNRIRSANLLPGPGIRYISVRYRDDSNNVSQVFTDSILLTQ